MAKLTGYSLGTVSMSLRGDLRISENTRALILGAADRLGYTPDALFARRMANVRQRARGHAPIKLAHVVAWRRLEDFYANPPLRDFRAGAADRAAEYGYELEDFHLDEASMSRLRLAGILRARSIPGVLLAPAEQLASSLNSNDGDARPELDFTAYATIGYTVNILRISRTVHDHAGALELACAQLRARGYRRIGLVLSENMHHRVHGRWLAGWVCAQPDPFDAPRPLVSRDFGKPAVFDRWLAREKPDVLIASDLDVVTAHLKRLGLRAPDDLGLVDLQGSSAISTHAAIDQSSREVGAAAVDIIIGQINRHERGEPSIPKTVLVPGRWIDGPSVRPAPEPKA
ncbi:MAG: substrate-binding domain-containing protein [Rariglobus sp.]